MPPRAKLDYFIRKFNEVWEMVDLLSSSAKNLEEDFRRGILTLERSEINDLAQINTAINGFIMVIETRENGLIREVTEND